MTKHEKLMATALKLRQYIVEMLAEAGSGHPGGSLSACEILTTLYFKEMRIDPKRPHWEDRDRFVLSKGHGAPVLYATLAERGYFPKTELMKLRKMGALLQGHPDMKTIPGVDLSTGSLGQGLAASAGMALAGKIDDKNYRVYALIGDGEVQEGLVWESAMFSAHHRLDNLTVFLDHNGLQIDGKNEEVMNIEPIDQKWASFGWRVITVDGHSFDAIMNGIEQAKNTKDKPTIIIANTVKGKGVSFMENAVEWHGKAPNRNEAKLALKELGGVQ